LGDHPIGKITAGFLQSKTNVSVLLSGRRLLS
jgi:hypothetical protein